MMHQREDTRETYTIRLRGHLDGRWAEWFDGFALSYMDGDTILQGSVPDQAALHGVFAKIRDLGLIIDLVVHLGHEVDHDKA